MTHDRATVLIAVAGAMLSSSCAAMPAVTQPTDTVLAVDQVAGLWRLRGNDGASCDLALANLVVDGVRPVLAERCGIAVVTGARSWRSTAQGFELLDTDGTVVMAFRQTGEEDFLAVGGSFQLSRAPLS